MAILFFHTVKDIWNQCEELERLYVLHPVYIGTIGTFLRIVPMKRSTSKKTTCELARKSTICERQLKGQSHEIFDPFVFFFRRTTFLILLHSSRFHNAEKLAFFNISVSSHKNKAWGPKDQRMSKISLDCPLNLYYRTLPVALWSTYKFKFEILTIKNIKIFSCMTKTKTQYNFILIYSIVT